MHGASKLWDVLCRQCTVWWPDVLKETAEVRCSPLGVNLLDTLLGAPRVLGKTPGFLGASCLAVGIPVSSCPDGRAGSVCMGSAGFC